MRPPGAGPCPGEAVPARLRHLFWDILGSGGSIARRLLRSGDLEGLAWGAAHLRAADWEHGATARGLDAMTRRLAQPRGCRRAVRLPADLRAVLPVMEIERRLGRTAEEGLALYRAAAPACPRAQELRRIILSLGYLDDVDNDDSLPTLPRVPRSSATGGAATGDSAQRVVIRGVSAGAQPVDMLVR